MLKLYGGLLTRAFIVEWYLLELEIPYEFLRLNMSKGEHLQPDFLAINPMGKLPALVDGDFKLWESGAILLYLAEKYDRLPKSLEQRATLVQWVTFANATLIPNLFTPQTCDREVPRLLPPLDRRLQSQSYLLGDRFSVADVAVGAVLAYIPLLLNLDLSGFPKDVETAIKHLENIDFLAYPHIVDYRHRLCDRPTFQKSIAPLSALAKEKR